MTSATPASASGSPEASANGNAEIESEPLQPYRNAMPISSVAVAAPPSTRYLRAASTLCARIRPSSTRAYTGSDMISMPRNRVGKLSDEMIRHAPYSEASTSV